MDTLITGFFSILVGILGWYAGYQTSTNTNNLEANLHANIVTDWEFTGALDIKWLKVATHNKWLEQMYSLDSFLFSGLDSMGTSFIKLSGLDLRSINENSFLKFTASGHITGFFGTSFDSTSAELIQDAPQWIKTALQAFKDGKYAHVNLAQPFLEAFPEMASTKAGKILLTSLGTSNPSVYLEQNNFAQEAQKTFLTKGWYKYFFNETSSNNGKTYLSLPNNVCQFAEFVQPGSQEICNTRIDGANQMLAGSLYVQSTGDLEVIVFDSLLVKGLFSYQNGEIIAASFNVPMVGQAIYKDEILKANFSIKNQEWLAIDFKANLDFSNEVDDTINMTISNESNQFDFGYTSNEDTYSARAKWRFDDEDGSTVISATLVPTKWIATLASSSAGEWYKSVTKAWYLYQNKKSWVAFLNTDSSTYGKSKSTFVAMYNHADSSARGYFSSSSSDEGSSNHLPLWLSEESSNYGADSLGSFERTTKNKNLDTLSVNYNSQSTHNWSPYALDSIIINVSWGKLTGEGRYESRDISSNTTTNLETFDLQWNVSLPNLNITGKFYDNNKQIGELNVNNVVTSNSTKNLFSGAISAYDIEGGVKKRIFMLDYTWDYNTKALQINTPTNSVEIDSANLRNMVREYINLTTSLSEGNYDIYPVQDMESGYIEPSEDDSSEVITDSTGTWEIRLPQSDIDVLDEAIQSYYNDRKELPGTTYYPYRVSELKNIWVRLIAVPQNQDNYYYIPYSLHGYVLVQVLNDTTIGNRTTQAKSIDELVAKIKNVADPNTLVDWSDWELTQWNTAYYLYVK